MKLSSAIFEKIATQYEYDVEAIKKLDNIEVPQYMKREIVEAMVGYPSLIEELAIAAAKEGITSVDAKYSDHAIKDKPHWVHFNKATYTLVINR